MGVSMVVNSRPGGASVPWSWSYLRTGMSEGGDGKFSQTKDEVFTSSYRPIDIKKGILSKPLFTKKYGLERK